MDGNSVNLVIQASNGQQKLIKIVRQPNSLPLTAEGVQAIVKEVTGHDASKVLGQSTSSNTMRNTHYSNTETIISNYTQRIKQEPADSSSHTANKIINKPTSFKMTQQQLAAMRNVQKQSTSKLISPQTSNTFTTVQMNQQSKKMQGTAQHTIGRKRKTDRVGKGLRHFSMKVCEKVKEKGTTTYNEVADELVLEEAKGQPIDPANFDQKNIRRRVYDALNVLMAMNIISKDKKEIRWIGLPTNSAQQCSNLEKENQSRKERIEAKKLQLRELILQQVSFKSLVTRNKEAEERGLVPSPSSAIQLPFIIVNTHKKTNINCSITNDKSEYFFKFDDKFEIHDDIEVLKRMGLLLGLDKGECTYDDIERAKTMVPKTFEKYIEIYGKGLDEVFAEEWDMMPMDMIEGTITKSEVITDEEDMDDDHYTDASDIE